MGIIYSGLTDVGLVRKNNQDSIYLNSQHNLFVVADGMGGHKGGEVASKMAVDKIAEHFIQNNDSNMDPAENVEKAIHNANSAIFLKSQQDNNLTGMGTTVVGLYFNGQNVYIGNIGDSRAYLVQNNKMYQLSRDHSLVQEKLKIGLYNREQAAKDPNKNVLSRSCGINDKPEIDVFTYKVKKNDFFLICSDGLSGMVSDDNILQEVNKAVPKDKDQMDKLVEKLIELAKANGGQDNISVITVLAQ